jgi:tRNA pseudouridine55 synthase
MFESMNKSGLVLVKKPKGISSFDVVKILRKQLKTKKIGHSGTLDPFATGLLIMGVNQGTKALSHLILSEKSYQTKIIFGVSSDTQDKDGNISFCKVIPNITKTSIERALKTFKGESEQIPPKFSAIKIHGKRACDRVRSGEDITLPSRKVHIFESHCTQCGIEEEGPFTNLPYAKIFLRVSSGFYVRSFARDIGKYFNTSALCSKLQRDTLDRFSVLEAQEPEKISEKDVFPLLPHFFPFPSISLSEKEWEDFSLGRTFKREKKEGKATIFWKNIWRGFAIVQKGIVFPKKVLKDCSF